MAAERVTLKMVKQYKNLMPGDVATFEADDAAWIQKHAGGTPFEAETAKPAAKPAAK